MDFKFLKSGSPTEPEEIELPQGRYKGIWVRLYGTTAAGVTLAESHMPFCRVMYDGEQYQGEYGDFYHNWNDLYGGNVATFSGGANAAEDIWFLIPFEFPGQENVLLVPNGDIAKINIDWGLDNANWDTNPTYEAYGLITPGVKRNYDLYVRQQNRSPSAATRDSFTLSGRNLAALYLRDQNSKVDKVTMSIDGKTVWDNVDPDVLTQLTDYARKLESAGVYAEYNAFERAGGRFQGAINNQTNMELEFNASGEAEITKFQVRPNPENKSRPRTTNV